MAESAQSVIDICNQALTLSGNARITQITEPNGRVCELLYPRIRDEIMAEPGFVWNIAKARAQLSELADTPAFGWDHQFTLPADLLRVVSQVTELRQIRSIIPWEREGDVLLTNQTTCFILYVKRITDPAKFPPLLYEAIYTKLASSLATRLSKDPLMSEKLLRKYETIVLPRAKEGNAAENYVEEEQGWDDIVEAGRYYQIPWPR